MRRDAKVSLFLIILSCLAYGPNPVRSAPARPLPTPRAAAPPSCSNWMTPSYSTYTSFTTDGTRIYTTVSVSGTTTGYCPYGCQCYPYHSGHAYNTVGGVGGWLNGGNGPWNGWISVNNYQQIPATVNTEYVFMSSTNVRCSAAGTIYGVIGTTYLKIVWTTLKVWSVLHPALA